MDIHTGVSFILLALCVVVTIGNSFVTSSGELTETEVIEYLKETKYINNDVTVEICQLVHCKFQEMADLSVTGELNDETLSKMLQPRCGFPDVRQRIRTKYAVGRDAMNRAFDIWAKEVPLTFQYIGNPLAIADLDIKFVTKDHSDGTPFDGRGGFNAHAFLPPYGQIHFDDNEIWLTGSMAAKSGFDLYIVAVHEFGHALGLHHSKVPGSIMGPYYSYTPSLKLHVDDINGIQSLYGKHSKKRKSSWWFLRNLP
ncbi:hypothetical protein ACJMK2_011502 [Sinanodonta woodiana]|uniref:Peptidase metallopeptidase domain-containing protein n=1 Tax=Sinanodonta woodiana TaxID=1069815 RepID=A0ABD3V5R6_SINWO